MNWISLIPVRAGSKGLINKNILQVGGKPLYRHTVDFALDSGSSKVYITTDIEEILAGPAEQKISLVRRKKNQCSRAT